MLKSLTELKLIPLPNISSTELKEKKNLGSNIRCETEYNMLYDPTNYGIFDYSQENHLKYTNVQKFYPKTYPMQNSPKVSIQHHWTS